MVHRSVEIRVEEKREVKKMFSFLNRRQNIDKELNIFSFVAMLKLTRKEAPYGSFSSNEVDVIS